MMERVFLGPLKVSVIALGTWQFGDSTGTYTKQSEETEFEIVQTALANNINFFDTAEAYGQGQSEKSLAKALAKTGVKREDYYLASKVFTSNLSREGILQSCEQTLKNLNTSYLDLYQIHWPSRSIDMKETFATLNQLKEEGKIRAIGISNFGVLDIKDAVTFADILTNQLPYNLATRSIEDGIVDECQKHKIGILAYCPLAQGLLAGKYRTLESALENPGLCRSRFFHKSRSPKSRHTEEGCEEELFKLIDVLVDVTCEINKTLESDKQISPSQVALAWLLIQRGVSCVIVGASSAKQVVENANAIAIKSLLLKDQHKHLLERLTLASDPVKSKLGGNPDLWDSVSRFR